VWLSVSQVSGVVLCDHSLQFWKFQWQRSPKREWELARQLYTLLQPDDVVVADSAYGTYLDLTLVCSANADAVFRKHHARHCDFRALQEVGHW
jgi:hypothetical protein